MIRGGSAYIFGSEPVLRAFLLFGGDTDIWLQGDMSLNFCREFTVIRQPARSENDVTRIIKERDHDSLERDGVDVNIMLLAHFERHARRSMDLVVRNQSRIPPGPPSPRELEEMKRDGFFDFDFGIAGIPVGYP